MYHGRQDPGQVLPSLKQLGFLGDVGSAAVNPPESQPHQSRTNLGNSHANLQSLQQYLNAPPFSNQYTEQSNTSNSPHLSLQRIRPQQSPESSSPSLTSNSPKQSIESNGESTDKERLKSDSFNATLRSSPVNHQQKPSSPNRSPSKPTRHRNLLEALIISNPNPKLFGVVPTASILPASKDWLISKGRPNDVAQLRLQITDEEKVIQIGNWDALALHSKEFWKKALERGFCHGVDPDVITEFSSYCCGTWLQNKLSMDGFKKVLAPDQATRGLDTRWWWKQGALDGLDYERHCLPTAIAKVYYPNERAFKKNKPSSPTLLSRDEFGSPVMQRGGLTNRTDGNSQPPSSQIVFPLESPTSPALLFVSRVATPSEFDAYLPSLYQFYLGQTSDLHPQNTYHRNGLRWLLDSLGQSHPHSQFVSAILAESSNGSTAMLDCVLLIWMNRCISIVFVDHTSNTDVVILSHSFDQQYMSLDGKKGLHYMMLEWILHSREGKKRLHLFVRKGNMQYTNHLCSLGATMNDSLFHTRFNPANYVSFTFSKPDSTQNLHLKRPIQECN